MTRQYARFDSVTIGPGLVATDGGLVLTTAVDSTSLARAARSTFTRSGGRYGCEFVFWGDASLLASVGLVAAGAPLNAEVGVSADTIGWRFSSGEVRRANVVMASGLPAVVKGDILGVEFVETAGPVYAVRFSLNGTQVAEVLLTGAIWHYAVSMASAVAGELSCAVNAGQWPARGSAARSGWAAPTSAPPIVRLADRHWMTAPGDDPAHTRYEGRIIDDGIETMQHLGFWPWRDAVAPRQGGAQVRLQDPDGALAGIDRFEALVALRTVSIDGSLADSEPLHWFAVDSIEAVADDVVRLALRDAHDALDEPVNSGVFLPFVPALAWRPQPVVIGAVASVPLLSANSDGTVGFLADSPVASVDVVLDRGDALEPGTWSLAPGDQQLLLESPPLGPVLADVSSIGADMTPATLSQALHAVCSRVRFSAWQQTDADAIDAATGYAGIGYYLGTAVQSARQVRDAMLASYAASAWQDSEGVMRIARLIDPETVDADLDLQRALLDGDLVWAYDDAPNLTRRMGYRPNAQTMSAGDFVTDTVDVPMSRRVELMQPFRGIVYSAVPMHPRYDAADRREAMPSMFWERADAQAEIDRICALYAEERRFYAWSGTLDQEVRPGHVARVTYDRYGLEAGRNLLIVSVQRNRATRRTTLRLWGA